MESLFSYGFLAPPTAFIVLGVAGALMQAVLEGDFAVPVTWNEDQSQTTWDNAAFTARLLLPEKLTTVALVSQPWHLPRAMWAFDRVGFHPIPWPGPRTVWKAAAPGDFLPNIGALHDSFLALHEIVGRAYYRLRH